MMNPVNYQVCFERLTGCLPRPAIYTYTLAKAQEIAKNCREQGGYKDIKIYDLNQELGTIFPYEHYYLAENGWEIE